MITNERFAILDILRGIALLGICFANFGELSLYTFQSAETQSAMPTAYIDSIIKFFQYFLIDGKFYTLFSLLFGIGFTIILSNCEKDGRKGYRFFYRRMIIFAFIGISHMILLWAGDILLLYALLGMLLPLFYKLPDKKLLLFAIILLLTPIFIDFFSVLMDGQFSLMILLNGIIKHLHTQAGITSEDFATWLRDSDSYADVLRFNFAGFFIRIGEFVEGNRLFKVLGIFLLGVYAGRKRLYAGLPENKRLIVTIRNYGFMIGIPMSLLYAWNSISHYAAGIIGSEVIYIFSIIPMGLAYAAAIYLWYSNSCKKKAYLPLANTGKMALANYIGQSVIGMIIYYGIGFALGATMGLVYVQLIAFSVYIFQLLISNLWLKQFRYGPLEWVWRMMTYQKYISLIKMKNK